MKPFDQLKTELGELFNATAFAQILVDTGNVEEVILENPYALVRAYCEQMHPRLLERYSIKSIIEEDIVPVTIEN